jgi:two-component system chemotaxis sensor kinase CheA
VSLPLTLATIRALLVACAGQVFALPLTGVVRLVRLAPSEVASVAGRDMLPLAGQLVPLAALDDVLGLAPSTLSSAARVPVVVLSAGDQMAALAVDELLAEQEVVVKSLGPRLRRVRHFGGATVLPSGRVALILSPSDLVASTCAPSPRPRVAAAQPQAAPQRRLLVVDDSVTTRALVKSILEAAGYAVTTAPDGAEAWRLLQERGAELIVADVEMPRLDGFGLCQLVRGSRRFREVPIVLVTALASPRDRARGLEVGADAYLLKGDFDQTQLLATIAQLLGTEGRSDVVSKGWA